MQVILRVRPELALALHGRQLSSSESEEILQTATELGVTLSPMHPGTEDPSLASYFTIEVPERATAEEVIARLNHCHGVEAAYLKPPDELP
jgi:hypothetical protein